MSKQETPIVDVTLRCADSIEPKKIGWIWKDWLAKGKFQLLAGQGGIGKTTLALSLAATISSGGTFPDGSKCEKGSVLIWSGEDNPDDTLVPRLILAEGDLSNIYFVGDTITEFEKRCFDPSIDMYALMKKANEIDDLSLIIIDPIVNAVAGDSHKNGEVRRALQPVVDFGEKLNCAVLGITHFSKGGQGKDPLERVTGSLAFGALARIVIFAGRIDEGGEASKSIVCIGKSNIGTDYGGFEYEVHQAEIQGDIQSSKIEWRKAVYGSAKEIFSKVDKHYDDDNCNSALDNAKSFLLAELANGDMSQVQLKINADTAGLSWRTIERAKKKLCIKSVKSNIDNKWYWSL